MCGVLGLVAHEPVNQSLYDGLQMLQHRGQDAAGIVTTQNGCFHMHKGKGMVREVFRTRNMATRALPMCATPPRAMRAAPPKRSRFMSARPSASYWRTTAI